MYNTELNFEIQRKVFHLCSLIFPIAYLFTSKIIMAIIITVVTGITLYLDISRHYNPKIKELIKNIFGKFLREDEESGQFVLSGASYMALGLLTSCLLFSKGLAITSWLVLIVADCFAAIIGMKYGSPLFNGKSYVGSVSFFISSVLISVMTYFIVGYSTSFFIILISSLVTTIVEFFSDQIKVNDNFSIPITYALVTFLLSLMV
ncbi:MAG: SEC59/DGK1/VTE5 family protein [Rickettsiaceae bacterium]|jgi:dolichol kinase|nr:SEC59/DGK1/VTE5 family protein [Rickettsiaceae bacterium]